MRRTPMRGLVRSFAYLGGVTKTVLVDNQKSAVIAHRVGEGCSFTRAFWTWRGITDLCRRRAGRTGRVPRARPSAWCAYVKEHFFVRYRQFETLVHLNQQLESWLREEADPRVHGTHPATRYRPV